MKVINSKIVNGKKMFLIEEPIKKLGGVIEDNQGQWKYPGQITKINSPNITMKGVPYPVLGISDKGDKQMMYPNGEYKFDGQSVTEYPITAQAGTTVKVNKDNVIREYDRRSPEYKAMYDSGRLMSYDKSTDTYRATPLETFEVKTKAPQWLIDKRNIEKNFTKEKFVKKYLPKWSGSMGETADNLSENAQKDYDKKVNDKLANVLLKSNQKKGNKEANNLDWYNSFSEKEREIIQQSSLANKFAPAQRAYDLDVSNSTKKYNTIDVLTDADKLSQSVQGTPERFRLFPNAENNIESYVNAGMFFGRWAKGLGNVPKDIKNKNYGQAALSIATPLGVGALAGIGNPSTGQFVNNIANPFAGTGNLVNKLGNKYLPNAYKLNPNALKEAQEQMLVRARPIGQDPYINMAESLKAKEAAGEQLKWYQKNLLNPQTNPNIAAREKYFGQWFADNPSDLDFYINPGTRNFTDDAQIEILKARMPKSEASKYSVKNFEDAKKLSNLHDAEFILPKDMVQQLERHSVDDLPKLIKEYDEINKPHWLKGYKQVEVPKTTQNFKSEIDNIQFNISKLKSEKELYEKNYQSLVSKYKNKEITPEQYKIEYQKIAPENPYLIGDLEKQVRELKVKQDIFNTPQKNILTSETQLGKNISDGGSNNKGVFELGDNYVAKLSAHGYDDASRLVNYADKLTSPRIMKTHQVKEFNGKVYQVQDKATGIPYTQLSEQQLKNLPKNHIDNFYKDIAELEKNGLNIDISGGKSNIFYDSKKGFQFIDLGIGKMPNINDVNKVVAFKNGGAIGNNGMFDMTNPNIYKTLVGGLATGTLGKKAMEKKEFGGKILNTKIENGKKYFLINE